MAEKHPKRRKNRNKKHEQSGSTPDDIIGEIFRASAVALRRRRLDPMKKLVALSIGVLAAVKLLLRLQNRGKTVYAGDPHVWEIIEQASDDLAADHFQHIAGDFSSAGIPGIRLKGERAYLHLVQNRERFQWCPAQIKDDETSPFPPGTMRELVPEVGDAVTFAIIGSLAKIRQSSLPKDVDGQLNHTLAETVALVAAAKVHLAVCGNGKLAAGVERIADQVSEVLYKQYRM